MVVPRGRIAQMMRAMSCVGGETQIERVLSHAIRETGKNRGGAVVFVGDAMEEKVDRLGRLAVELGPLRPSSSTKAATRPPRQHSSKLPPSQGCLLAVRSCRHSSAQGIARGILRSLRSAAIGRSKRSPQKGWRDPAPQPPARATLNVPRQASALLAERRSRQGPRLPDPP